MPDQPVWASVPASVTDGQVPTANGEGGYAWASPHINNNQEFYGNGTAVYPVDQIIVKPGASIVNLPPVNDWFDNEQLWYPLEIHNAAAVTATINAAPGDTIHLKGDTTSGGTFTLPPFTTTILKVADVANWWVQWLTSDQNYPTADNYFALLTLSANIPVASGAVIPFNTLTTQDGTEVIENNGLEIPTAGVYEVSGLVIATAATGGFFAELYQNATAVAESQFGPTATAVAIVPTLLQCAAGDVIAMNVEGAAVTVKGGATLGTYLNVKRIA